MVGRIVGELTRGTRTAAGRARAPQTCPGHRSFPRASRHASCRSGTGPPRPTGCTRRWWPGMRLKHAAISAARRRSAAGRVVRPPRRRHRCQPDRPVVRYQRRGPSCCQRNPGDPRAPAEHASPGRATGGHPRSAAGAGKGVPGSRRPVSAAVTTRPFGKVKNIIPNGRVVPPQPQPASPARLALVLARSGAGYERACAGGRGAQDQGADVA